MSQRATRDFTDPRTKPSDDIIQMKYEEAADILHIEKLETFWRNVVLVAGCGVVCWSCGRGDQQSDEWVRKNQKERKKPSEPVSHLFVCVFVLQECDQAEKPAVWRAFAQSQGQLRRTGRQLRPAKRHWIRTGLGRKRLLVKSKE